MATRVNYDLIIDEIKKNKGKKIEITQKSVKKICNNELPKSMFTKNYIKRGENDLTKFILSECEWELVEPKIIIKWKN